jgi:hypothetical protein
LARPKIDMKLSVGQIFLALRYGAVSFSFLDIFSVLVITLVSVVATGNFSVGTTLTGSFFVSVLLAFFLSTFVLTSYDSDERRELVFFSILVIELATIAMVSRHYEYALVGITPLAVVLVVWCIRAINFLRADNGQEMEDEHDFR